MNCSLRGGYRFAVVIDSMSISIEVVVIHGGDSEYPSKMKMSGRAPQKGDRESQPTEVRPFSVVIDSMSIWWWWSW